MNILLHSMQLMARGMAAAYIKEQETEQPLWAFLSLDCNFSKANFGERILRLRFTLVGALSLRDFILFFNYIIYILTT